MEEKQGQNHPAEKPEHSSAARHNWVTDLYDRANISVRQLNILLVCLLALIVALFVIFGK